MANPLFESIDISIDDGKVKRNIKEKLVGIQVNFVNTENERSNEKAISVMNENQKSEFKGNYLIIQFHLHSENYVLLATKEIDISKNTEQLYSGDLPHISIKGNNENSDLLIQMTTKEKPSPDDWEKWKVTGSKIDIELIGPVGPVDYYELGEEN